MRNVRIVCTIGPASDDRATIRALTDAGMSVARLNASHGTTSDRADAIDRIRLVDQMTESPLATMVDLQGPEVRTAPLDQPITLDTGSEIQFFEGESVTSKEVGLSYSINTVEEGDTVLLDDGRIETTVLDVDGDVVHARVDSGNELGSRKGVNVPGVDLDIDLITEADKRELKLAADKEVDFVASSFVRDGSDVYTISDTLEELGAEIPVIAKIERAGAVDNIDSIVDAAFGVMVARGDLGVECPLEEVPVVQKRIIRACQHSGVPVITATEMLDSMIDSQRPTRAEASDVANAVLDGSDAIMLSGETAVGEHPVTVVETMDRIVRQVESSDEYTNNQEQHIPPPEKESRTEALARSARYLARDVGAAAIVAVSESGYTARKTTKFRPNVPIIATTPNDHVRRQLALSWGIDARFSQYAEESVEGIMEKSVTAALNSGVAESGDTIVVLSGMMSDLEGMNTTNMLKVHVVAEDIARGRSVVSGRVSGTLMRTSDGDLSQLQEGSILAIGPDFDGKFDGDPNVLAGIVDARPGMTGYPALVARELGIPMISGAPISESVNDGTQITLHAERGIVYRGDVLKHETT